MSDDVSTRGWDAINAQLKPLYGDQEPQHWGTIIRWRLGGPDPLDGVSAYDAGDHWHYVTFGLTELYAKETGDTKESGYGYELTFRLAKAGPSTAPLWPASFLQNLARYTFTSGNVLAVGDHMDCNGPIALDERTELCAFVVARDPRLAALEVGPFGRFDFRQVVALTRPELRALQSWNGNGILAEVAKRNPLLVTALARPSYLEDPTFRDAVAAGCRRDGSSTGVIFVDQLAFELKGLIKKKVHVVLGATAVPLLQEILPGRIPFGRGFALAARGAAVRFEPGTPAARSDKEGALVHLDAATTTALVSTLAARRGEYLVPGLPGAVFEVRPSLIRDRDGNVTETIG